MRNGIKIKTKIFLGLVVLIIIITLACGSKIIETVKSGTYQIKQAAVSGNMSAHMQPGLYFQNFGDVGEWPKAETYYFTSDKDSDKDKKEDASIEVRFNEGSLCNISGTCRVVMPISSKHAIELITVHGYQSYDDLANELILKVIRNSLRLTANLMSAR